MFGGSSRRGAAALQLVRERSRQAARFAVMTGNLPADQGRAAQRARVAAGHHLVVVVGRLRVVARLLVQLRERLPRVVLDPRLLDLLVEEERLRFRVALVVER